MSKPILAYYLRISDEDYDLKNSILKDESTSISAQRSLILQYIQTDKDLHTMEIQEFLDDGYSGTNFERPAIQNLFSLMLNRKIGCIIVKDISRLGRNYIETGNYIEQIFPFLGIRFISINDTFDSGQYIGNTPGLDVAFKNILYDYYSKDLSTKVKSIKKLQQQRGEFVAAKPPYGYIISPADRHKLEVDKDAADVVKSIYQLTLSGKTPAEIASILNKQHHPTPAQRLFKLYGFKSGNMSTEELMTQFWKPFQVAKILKDETVTGAIVNNRVQVKGIGSRKFKRQKKEDYVVVKDVHEAIIDDDTFQQVAHIIKARTTTRTDIRRKHENLFHQKIYCANCGCRLKHEVKIRNGKKQAFYYCPYARPSGGGICHLKPIKDEYIKCNVLKPLQTHVQLILDEQIKTPKSNLEILQNQLQSILHQLEQNKKQIPRLYEEYRTGLLSREKFIKQKEAISILTQKLESEKGELGKQIKEQELNKKKSELEQLLEITRLETLTQEAVNQFVNKICVHSPNSIEITWKWANPYYECTKDD